MKWFILFGFCFFLFTVVVSCSAPSPIDHGDECMFIKNEDDWWECHKEVIPPSFPITPGHAPNSPGN